MIYPSASQVDTLESEGLMTTTSFTIAANAKAFELLSTRVYKDAIRAVIRELSSNAWDSHIMSGNTETPFKVLLPNYHTPTFVVEDFGLGMSHDQVMNLYTTCFDSNKNNSNNPVGAHGIGSKSPFSIVDIFTVIVTFEGKRRIYTAYKENRLPKISMMSEEDSDQPNGVRVEFAVNPNNFSRFQSSAFQVFKYFDNYDMDGMKAPVLEYTTSKLKDDGKMSWGFRKTSGSYGEDGIQAIQGPVAYPLTLPREHQIPEYDILSNLGLDIYFPIGTLDVTLSREELHYDEITIQNIKNRMVEVVEELKLMFISEFDKFDNSWDANAYYQDRFAQGTTLNKLKNLLKDYKSDNFILNQNFGQVSYKDFVTKQIMRPDKDGKLVPSDLSVRHDEWDVELVICEHHYTSRRGDHIRRRNWVSSDDHFNFIPSSKSIFIFDDDKNTGQALAEQYMKENPSKVKTLYLFRGRKRARRTNAVLMAEDYAFVTKMLDKVNATHLLQRVSTLDASLPERVKIAKEQLDQVYEVRDKLYRVEVKKLPEGTKYYIGMSHHTLFMGEKEVRVEWLNMMINLARRLGMKIDKVFGIPRTKKHLLDSDWVNVGTELENFAKNFAKNKIKELSEINAAHGLNYELKNLMQVVSQKKLLEGSFFRKLADQVSENLKKTNLNCLDFFTEFGIEITPTVLPDVTKRYRLLNNINYYSSLSSQTAIVEYIELIDAKYASRVTKAEQSA